MHTFENKNYTREVIVRGTKMMMTSNSHLVFICFSVIVGLIPAVDVNKAPAIGNPFLIHAEFHFKQFTRLNFGHRLAQ